MPRLTDLKPYASLVLATSGKRTVTRDTIRRVVAHLEELLELSNRPQHRLISSVRYATSGDMLVGYIHYAEERTPPWTADPSVKDKTNHLALVCAKHAFIAIFLSETDRRTTVLSELGRDPQLGLGLFTPLDHGILNAAFAQGPTRTLWLAATHRRTSVSADNKVLTGLNLRDALDPLADQTYHFTAARCIPTIRGIRKPIGVSPRNSAIWAGRSTSWTDFRLSVESLLDHLQGVSNPDFAPFPILAVSTTTPSAVGGAFDAAFVPPELLGDPTVNADDLQIMEKWGYRSRLEVTPKSGPDISAEVYLDGQLLGHLDIAVDVSTPTHVTLEAQGKSTSTSVSQDFNEALNLSRRPAWIKIWYDSGHTISNGGVYEVRHRDIPFKDFQWADFTDFDVKKEKPSSREQLGTEDSLFDWTLKHWPDLLRTGRARKGWLALDDHSMETADFVSYDDTSTPPVLTLIHIKGSGSNLPTRTVSVSDYEVVCAQAIKNLRYLDTLHLSTQLAQGIKKSIGNFVWHDGAKSTRAAMVPALASAGTNYRTRIVILQPRLTRSRHDQSRARPRSTDMARLRQLDTLLVSTAASCHALGADLSVIGEGI